MCKIWLRCFFCSSLGVKSHFFCLPTRGRSFPLFGAQQSVDHSRRHIKQGFQILGLQPWMNCVILVTWSRLRWKSCDRMSSVSWTSRLPSIRSLWKTPTAASGRPMNRKHAETPSRDKAERSAGGRQVGSGGRDGPSVTPEGVPPPSAPLEKSVAGLTAGSGEGQGDWRLKGFKAPKGANRLCGGGGLSLGTEEGKESAHGSAQVACAGLGLVELSAGTEDAGSGLAGFGAGQSPQEQG